MNGSGWWFESLDRVRRFQGKALDRFDLGPQESPHQTIFSRPLASLRAYGTGAPGKPVLLVVPAPIKRPYIWDLCPETSVVRRALERGFQVYLVDWAEPGWQERRCGLDEYAGGLLKDCIDAAAAHARSDQVFLAGHSLGGTLAAIHGAWRPERVAGLVLIEAPLHFGAATGAFRKLLGLGIPAEALVPAGGRLPGSLLSLISARAAPEAFHLGRYFDYLASLGSREKLQTHWRVERWTLDEFPLPCALFRDVVEQLYREDRFMGGELLIGGTRLGPGNVSVPLFSVYDPDSTVIPPQSILAFQQAVASREKELMPYLGDTGIALRHVGALVGASAHQHIWPRIFDWLGGLAAMKLG